ncbi:MAG: hypothetical protein VYD87_05705 [Pseudomonadota bacterium]|nr:hypothetical protein [Pseudomonadota bacterium]
MTQAYRAADDSSLLRASRVGLRPAMLLSSTGLALVLATPAFASEYTSCPTPSSGTSQTCTTQGSAGYSDLRVTTTMGAGQNPPSQYTINNSLSLYGAGNYYSSLLLSITAGAGNGSDSNGNGYSGHNGQYVTINNSGTVSTPAPTSEPAIDRGRASPGDDAGAVFSIFAQTVGGTGANAPSTVIGGGDGGNGGLAGTATIHNTGSASVAGDIRNGMVAVYAEGRGGTGGRQDKDATYAQKGGNGGGGAYAYVTNDGSVHASGSSESYIWGIGAQAVGGEGADSGSNGAAGGYGGTAAVWNNGTVEVTGARMGDDYMQLGVRGISADSPGGDGRYSDDGDRNGADGGGGGFVTIQNKGSLNVSRSGAAVSGDSYSAGMVGTSFGGTGGESANTVTNTTNQRGGYGGHGGYVSLYNLGTISTTGDEVNGIVARSRGGDGGAGINDGYGAKAGDGEDVTVGLNGTIVTNGKNADGVVAISEGGTGGQQKSSSGFADFNSAHAGDGGAAGFVTINNDVYWNDYEAEYQAPSGFTPGGSITTHGDYSEGILAQSLGGAGGDSQGAFVLFGNSSHDSSNGGDAGGVSVNAHVSVHTYGKFSTAIFAQSIGGGGGNVGDGGGLIALSGDAGDGAHAGEVGVLQLAPIVTEGEGAIGIHAQSISGGGGRVANETGVITVGGQGGSSPKSNLADISAFSDITTSGDYAYGALAQSVGGGGGDGGSTFSISAGSIPAVAVGGDGGAAGDGGQAVIQAEANKVSTAGHNAHGLIAMSVGGGGGSGGDATSDAVSISSLAIAGGANSAGAGDTANVQTSGTEITTTGSHAVGVVALSVGGGGGAGGSASSFDASVGFSSAVAVGGSGGTGGAGGPAQAFLFGSRITTGDAGNLDVANAHGIIAASVGGGGGMGGSAASKAITATVPTEEPQVDGEVSLSLGGSGATGGHGGAVYTILEDTLVTTLSDGSTGMLALSVGGGGGVGGDAGASGAMLTLPATGENKVSFTVNIGVGGNAGQGSNGGAVTTELTGGEVVTHGDYSNGVHMLSLGGGGGVGGTGSAEKFNLEIPGLPKDEDGDGVDDNEENGDDEGEDGKKKVNVAVNFTAGIGGKGGAGGAGGAIYYAMDEHSNIVTMGQGSKGVLIHSIGGGGGASQGATVGLGASFLPAGVSLGVGRNGPNGGAGGDITDVALDGAVRTFGAGSDAVFIQSLGGGGGVGGSTGGAGADESGYIKEVNEIKEDLAGKLDIRLMIGGRGGAAGDGGDIGYGTDTGLSLGGQIFTYGDHSSGLVVQSIGAGGGDGGAGNAQTSLSLLRSFVAVGGNGGASGDGGRIKLELDGGTVFTQGVGSYGIFAHSIGGGGGKGGDATRSMCKKLNIGGGWAATALEAIGVGEDEEITPDDMCVEIPSWDNIQGKDGVAGDGGEVHVGAAGQIATVETHGDFSHAVVAQSIGAGGGVEATGNSYSANDPDATPDDLAVDVALGATGATKSSGTGGAVTVAGKLTLSTAGDGAAGILAQSIAGGGGFAGVNGIAGVALGAAGAEHGTSSVGTNVTVTLDSGSRIVTTGLTSHGILAQSIGGGGGFVAGALTDTALDGGNIHVLAGGTNHTTGDAASATVTTAGPVTTSGRFARAILAQSIAGGGGVYSGVDAGETGASVDVPVTLGAAMTSGSAGSVEVTPKNLTTSSRGADAVLAQSIGGGGGVVDLANRSSSDLTPTSLVTMGYTDGDQNTLNGGAVVVSLNGSGGTPNLTTSGPEAYAVLAQSIGGGGGVVTDATSSVAATVQVGATATGSNTAHAGTVTVTDYAGIVTAGDDAHAIVAQSIGGGGGVARLGTASGSARLGRSTASYAGDANTGGAVNVDVGFSGINGTSGDRAFGIVAQSIGGGGGILSTRGGTLDSLTLAGQYGRGDASDVYVRIKTNTGQLMTEGAGSHAIIAQSIGGGGGIGGNVNFRNGINLDVFDSDPTFGDQVGYGNGGAVTVDVQDDVTTKGNGAYGVIAQSIGGGGGIGGLGGGATAFAGKTSGRTNTSGVFSTAGEVTVNVASGVTVDAQGENSVGIFAQSLGDANPNPSADQTITLTVDGTVNGGTGDTAYGILAHGGNADNKLTVTSTGRITSGGATSVYYLGETSDNATSRFYLSNHGYISGNVVGYYADGTLFEQFTPGTSLDLVAQNGPTLGAPALTLVNRRGGVLTGADTYGGDVFNRGRLVVGDDAARRGLRIEGDFVQGAGGATVAAVDFVARRGAVLSVGGDAELAGKLEIAPTTVLKGAALDLVAVEGNTMGRFDEIRSELFTYGQTIHSGGVTVGPIMADFDQPRFGLSAEQKTMSVYLEEVFEASDETYGETFGALDAAVALDASSFGSVLTALAPGASLAGAASNLELSLSRFDNLLSCGDRPWDRRAASEGRCVIAQTTGVALTQDGRAGGAGYDGSVFSMTLGLRRPVEGLAMGDVTVGLMAAYERSAFDGDFGADSEGDTVALGVSATRSWGGLSGTLALGGSYGVHDVTRDFTSPTGAAKARSDYAAWSAGIRGRLDYGIEFGGLTVTPALDLDLVHAANEGYRETGAGAFDLKVEDGSETAFRATPSIGLAQTLSLGETGAATIWGTGGVSFSTSDAYTTTARFASSTAVGGFSSSTPVADVAARVAAGVSFAATERLDVGLRYDGAFGDGYTAHAGSLRLNWKF